MILKKSLIAALLVLGAVSAQASDLLNFNCKSANYEISVSDIEGTPSANYARNGEWNEGAEVALEKSYKSEKILAASLNVDGQAEKFEVMASKSKAGTWSGKIFSGKSIQTATCTVN